MWEAWKRLTGLPPLEAMRCLMQDAPGYTHDVVVRRLRESLTRGP